MSFILVLSLLHRPIPLLVFLSHFWRFESVIWLSKYLISNPISGVIELMYVHMSSQEQLSKYIYYINPTSGVLSYLFVEILYVESVCVAVRVSPHRP